MMLPSCALGAFVPLLIAIFALRAAASPAVPAAQGITPLSSADIAAFLPYTHFAAVAYCPPAVTLAWSCGANCEANPSFVPIAAGGDGDKVQFCKCCPALVPLRARRAQKADMLPLRPGYVGFNPPSDEIIVSHQGTNFSELYAIFALHRRITCLPTRISRPVLEDIDIILQSLSSDLFAGAPAGIQAHMGFADAQQRSISLRASASMLLVSHTRRTSADILQAVQTGLTKFGPKKVTVAAHSLGELLSYRHIQNKS